MAEAEHEMYQRIKTLGEGSFGKAFLVQHVVDKSLCVLKQISLSTMKESERKEALREAAVLEALKHPNIIAFREVYKTKKNKLCIVMDYADGKYSLHTNHLSSWNMLDFSNGTMCLCSSQLSQRHLVGSFALLDLLFLVFFRGVIQKRNRWGLV